MSDFVLSTPVLVCRWRLAQRRLPLQGRHLRALGERRIGDKPVPPELVAWAKQHIEQTLVDGARVYPDGVLMLAVDDEGRAAMSVGPYRSLAHTSANDLLRRAEGSRKESRRTGVSPEDLWLVQGDALVWGTTSHVKPSGVSSLLSDLARTLGMPVQRDEELLERCATEGIVADEAFLSSDEHGVVPASDRSGMRSQKFCMSYQKLLLSTRARKWANPRWRGIA